MRVTVIGLGYVGLVTAACFAEWDNEVIGVEIDAKRVEALRQGEVPFHEPGLPELVRRGIASGRLTFRQDGERAVAETELVFIAVNTHDGRGGWQTGTIQAALASLVPNMNDGAALVVRSTMPPDFVPRLSRIVARYREEAGKRPVPVLVNPEFLQEAKAIHDFMHPDRVVIGVADDPTGAGAERLRELYERAGAPILVRTAVDAGLSKLGANLFLATKISFANEMAALCDAFGGTIDEVMSAMSLDPRIGGHFLRAGVGFGGSCLPNQVTMAVRDARAAGIDTPLFAAVDWINGHQRRDFVDRIREGLGGHLGGARVALLGLAFKPNTDDLRDAPSLDIARMLLDGGASVVAYDPMPRARAGAAAIVDGLEVADTALDALIGAQAVGLVTEWSEFADLDWNDLRTVVGGGFVFDGRNALDATAVIAAGFQYDGFGRGGRGAPVPLPVATSPATVDAPAAQRRPAAVPSRRPQPARGSRAAFGADVMQRRFVGDPMTS
jgi:UDPglucose 6-dehydrogenase